MDMEYALNHGPVIVLTNVALQTILITDCTSYLDCCDHIGTHQSKSIQLNHLWFCICFPYKWSLLCYFRLKLLEIKAGVDGFMVYDMDLIEPMQKVSVTHKSFISVWSSIDFPITALAYMHIKTYFSHTAVSASLSWSESTPAASGRHHSDPWRLAHHACGQFNSSTANHVNSLINVWWV